MKNTLLMLCLLLLAGRGIHAQNAFAPVGAEWWYHGNNWDYYYGPDDWITNETWIDHAVVTADTVIQGISCRKVIVTKEWHSGQRMDTTFTESFSFYFYDNTDTVFFFSRRSSQFEPLYILNAAQGDTICLKNPYYPGSANGPGRDSTFCFTIDSIRMVVYDTTHLKTFYTRSLFKSTDLFSINWGQAGSGGSAGIINKGQYTEKLGGTYGKTGGFFPTATFHNPDGGLDITVPSGFLNCYTDAATHIKRGTAPCDVLSPPSSGIAPRSLPEAGITVYPNPARDRITIKAEAAFEKNTRYSLFDVTGRSMLEQLLPAGSGTATVSLTGFRAGVYYLAITTRGGKYYQKIIISP